MTITLKNVPDEVYRTLKRAAKEQGRSLNAQIIHTLEAEAALLERRRKLPELIKELDQFAKSLPPMEDSTPLIRQERQRR
jgi:plasmid stability protein